MAQPTSIVAVIWKYRRRFENELRRCRTLARARRLERDWTKTGTGVIDQALKKRPLARAMDGNKSVFKRHLADHAGHAVEEFEILFEK